MGDDNKNENIKVLITEYTKHIVKEAVTEAMKQHQDNCPLIKTVEGLASDMWGDASRDGVKGNVRVLFNDLVARKEKAKENVSFIKRPLFSGLVGAFFVVIGMVLKGAWTWFTEKV